MGASNPSLTVRISNSDLSSLSNSTLLHAGPNRVRSASVLFHSQLRACRFAALISLLCVALFSTAPAFNDEEASNQWASAFVWFQNGRNLTKTGQKPLALGSFEEALLQFEKVALEFPDYETKMVTFRIDSLKKDIAELKGELNSEEHEIAVAYFQFIQIIKRADEERYSARRIKALATLRIAKQNLEAIVEKNPDAFAPALKTQRDRLDRSIAWLDKQVGHLEETSAIQLTTNKGRPVKGTTEFIKETDLPQTSGKVASSGLFPNH